MQTLHDKTGGRFEMVSVFQRSFLIILRAHGVILAAASQHFKVRIIIESIPELGNMKTE